MGFSTLLVANRGEIACRIFRACRSLGLRGVAVYADGDRDALFVAEADEAVPLSGRTPVETYLDVDKLLDAARRSGAEAVHPGYGFLSENAGFARAVGEAGLAWIGPAPDTIAAMGDKGRARESAAAAGIPVLRGSRRLRPGDGADLAAEGAAIGFPLLVKATGGGGGIGMKVVESPDRLAAIVAATQAQAGRSFGDDGVLLEPYLAPARHVEVQVFGFGDGRAIHLFERDCSVQRRFQKVVEEAPAPRLRDETRRAMGEAAIALASAQSYAGAGTVEFLFHEPTGRFFFLEMNTRIQVEHGVTEMITGTDLVALQLRLAGGDDLSGLTQGAIVPAGHAIEVRVCAEDPSKAFRPSPGRLSRFDLPAPSPGLRVDTGYRAGDEVSPFYDSLLAKVICGGEDRAEAIGRLAKALAGVRIEGVASNLDFLRAVIGSEPFGAAALHTGFIAEHGPALLSGP